MSVQNIHLSKVEKGWQISSNKINDSDLCLDISDSIEEQVLSMMYRSENGSWCCTVCGKEFRNKTDMKRHIDSLHISNHPGYNCNYCGLIVKSKNALHVHVSTKHPLNWNIWLFCVLDVSNSIEEQVLSMMYRSDNGKWCCSVCGKDFRDKTDLRRHVDSTHIPNHPGYSCNYCGFVVKSKNALKGHISTRHPFKWNTVYFMFRCIQHNWRASPIHDVQVRKWKLVLFSVWQGVQN